MRARTLWDWLGLLGVPVVLAVGGFAFSRAERKNEQEIAAERAEQERARAEARAGVDRELAGKRANEERGRADDALRQDLVQDYLDRMSELLLNKGLATSQPDDPIRDVARARTLTVLRGLGDDGARKGYIVQFLYELGLIKGKEPVVELRGAELGDAILFQVDLHEVNLIGAHLMSVNLSWANLTGATLSEAYLTGATLISANLRGVDLSRTYLRGADLRGVDFTGADLRETDLIEVDLTGADLTGANLFGANLFGADLSRGVVSNEQLALTLSLVGATMPDGTKYTGVPPTTGAPPSASPAAAAQSGQNTSTT